MKESSALSRLTMLFIPDDAVNGLTELGMARIFVFTHLFGPLIAQPMTIYLYFASSKLDLPLIVMAISICSFWSLPLLLYVTGNFKLVALCSFQLLAGTTLFGAFNYGGFSSPFLPWFVVSLMLGLFYLYKNVVAVLFVFSLNVIIFLASVVWLGPRHSIPGEELRIIGWLSITSATLYMTWMALYYSRIIGLRSEFEAELEGQRATAVELKKAHDLAKETSEARAQFFSKMNHELRTPLNSIIGYTDIFLEDSHRIASWCDQRTRDVTSINAAGRHLMSLVTDILDVSRIEHDMMSIEISDCQVGAIFSEVVATASPTVLKNNNTFEIDCDCQNLTIRSDAKKLRQIMLNLLSNAGKFTENGQIKFTMSVKSSHYNSKIWITVQDTGIGIAEEALTRLFVDYEQADTTTFKRYGGTGIGLALSRKFAILLGGEISVSSSLGLGSKFDVLVPIEIGENTGLIS